MDEAKRARSERRLNRREVWARLWLKRILALLRFFDGAALNPAWRRRCDVWLQHLARFVLRMILIRTSLRPEFQNQCANARRDPRRPDPHVALRSTIGGALRRAMKAKTFQLRAKQILCVLERRDAHIEKLARRLRKGMTRVCAAPSRVSIGGDMQIPRAPVSSAFSAADTS